MHLLQGIDTVQCSYPTAILSPDLSSQNMDETQLKIFAKRMLRGVNQLECYV